MNIQAVYRGQLRLESEHVSSGAVLTTDASTEDGGGGEGFSPSDLVAAALGACILTILGMMAKRHGWALEGAAVQVEKEMVRQPIHRIGKLATTVTLPGGSLSDANARRRLENAVETCPVHRSLNPEIIAPIEFVYLEG
ncbi:MAG: OsmC family protein [Planctomycetota bacterium]